MIRALLAVVLCLFSASALAAQGNVQSTGVLAPGHAARWVTNSAVIGDAGGAAGSAVNGSGYLTELGITNTGLPLCINDALISSQSGYHRLCFGAFALGGGLISYDAVGGAAALPFSFFVNGQLLPTPGSINGMPFAADNIALRALESTFSAYILRGDFSVGLGAPPLVFASSASACTLNGGLGDGGSQVPASGGGCWNAKFTDNTGDIREWGVVCNNLTSSGNAALLNTAIVSGVGLSMPKKTCLLDATVTVAVPSTIKGAGIYSGSVFRAATGLNTDVLFNITATSNLDWEGFEIDGNKTNTSGFTCVGSGLVQKMRLDLYVHDCPVYDAFVGGTDVTITGEFSRSGSLSGLALVAGTSRFSVDAIAHDVATTGVGCAACTDGYIKVECTDAGQQAPFADCATAYAPGNARIIWDVTCHTSGNHCAHIGGNDMTIRLVGDDAAQSGLFLGTKFDEEDGTITVVGTNVTGSGGQTWTNCLHSCQFGAGNDVAQMVIDGVTYNVDHVVDDTHLVLQSAPANDTYSYTLFWYGYSFNITADVTISNASGGAGIYAIYLKGGHLKGAVRGSLGGVSCNSCVDVNIDVAAIGSQNHNIRIGGGTPYTTGTVTATNGSQAVVGVGTAWKSFVAPGDFIAVGTDTTVYAVDTVDSDTGLHLVSNYAGSQPGGSTYRAVEITDRVRVGGSANRSIAGSGMFFVDCVFCMASGMAESNAAYGYAEGGLSTSNLYSGAAFDNATAPALIGAGSYYTGKP